jgi:hypothetical protein
MLSFIQAAEPATAQTDYEDYVNQCVAETESARGECEKQLAVSCGVLAVTTKGGVPATYSIICSQRPDMDSCGPDETLLRLDKGTCMPVEFAISLCGGAREDYDGAYGAVFYDEMCAGGAVSPGETPSPAETPAEAPQPTDQAQPEPARPSFDCAGARLATEKAICASPELAYYDSTMAALYVQRRRSLTGARRQQLTSQQRNWLNRRNSCGSNLSCLKRVYEQRIRQLQ